MNVTEEILALFQKRGDGAYFGESVSMTEHALQAAYFAQVAGAPPACAKDRTHRLDRRSAARFKAAARRNSADYCFAGGAATGASTLTSGLRSMKLTAR